MRSPFLFVLLAICTALLQAGPDPPKPAKNKITLFEVDPQTSAVVVLLDSKPSGDFLLPANYRVATLAADGSLKWLDIKPLVINPEKVTVRLEPVNPDDTRNAKQILLFIATEGLVNQTSFGPQIKGVKPSKGGDGSAQKGSDSTQTASKSEDIFVNGSYSPGIHSAPQYTIDTSVGILFPVRGSISDYLGFLGTVNTNNRPTADPDSYRFFGVYEKVLPVGPVGYLQGLSAYWLFGGMEFDRKANNVNFISSPLLDFPMKLRRRPIVTGNELIPFLTLETGMELGDNFTNAIHSNGQGFIARGLFGAQFSLTFKPKFPGLQNIKVSSSYKLRLPFEDEVFTNTKTNAAGKAIDEPYLTTKARNYIKNQIGFGILKDLSFTVTHEYGELPPAFRFIENKVTLGFTYAIEPKNSVQGALTGK